jgi:osmotically-inducible protein OsmY
MTAAITTCKCSPLDRGPDQELERRVRLYLTHAGHRPVQAVTVEAHNGVITLRGRVPSYYARQLAIACAQHVAGVREVDDQIKASMASKTGG